MLLLKNIEIQIKYHFQIHAKFMQVFPNLLQYVKFKLLWCGSTYKNVSIFGKVYMCHLLVKSWLNYLEVKIPTLFLLGKAFVNTSKWNPCETFFVRGHISQKEARNFKILLNFIIINWNYPMQSPRWNVSMMPDITPPGFMIKIPVHCDFNVSRAAHTDAHQHIPPT